LLRKSIVIAPIKEKVWLAVQVQQFEMDELVDQERIGVCIAQKFIKASHRLSTVEVQFLHKEASMVEPRPHFPFGYPPLPYHGWLISDFISPVESTSPGRFG
jgi:hypothetical protein